MDFSIAAPAGVAAAAVLVLRGADPMITIPVGHVYLTLRPSAPFVVPPGAVAGSALPFSRIQGPLGALVRNSAAIAGSVVLLNPVAPTFFEAALARAIVDGLVVKAYPDDGALAAALEALVASLPVAGISPVYSPTPADLIPAEPLLAGAAAGHIANVNAITYGSLADAAAANGFCTQLGALCWYTLCSFLAPLRDAPNQACRTALVALAAASTAADVRGPDPVGKFLVLSAPPHPWMLDLTEDGVGMTRRETSLTRRITIFAPNDVAALRRALAPLLRRPAAISALPVCAGRLVSLVRADAAVFTTLDELLLEVSVSSASSVNSLAILLALERKAQRMVTQGALNNPSLAVAGVTAAQIIEAFADRVRLEGRSTGSSAGASAGKPAAAIHDTYRDALALAMSNPTWFALEASLPALCAGADPTRAVTLALMGSDILAVRQFALLQSRGNVAAARSPNLLACKRVLRERDAMLAREVLRVLKQGPLSAEDNQFELSANVLDAINGYQLDTVNWISELVVPALEWIHRPDAQRQVSGSDAYLDAVYTGSLREVFQALEPLMGLPSTPPAPPVPVVVPGAPPIPPPAPPANWMSLSMIFYQVFLTAAPLSTRVDPFAADDRANLIRFVIRALRDSGRHLNPIMSDENPCGSLPSEAVPTDAACVGLLTTLRTVAASSLETRRHNPSLHAALSSFMAAHGPSATDGGSGVKRSRSPSATRSASPALSTADPKVVDTVDGKGFYYTDAGGAPLSAPWLYEPLEAYTGRSRHELDFAVLLDVSADPATRMRRCRFRGLAGHDLPHSTAHVCSGLRDHVFANKSHFRQPGRTRPPSSA